MSYLVISFINFVFSTEMKRVGSSTSSLIRHLQGKHPSKLDEKYKKHAELGPLDAFVINSEVCLHLILFSKTETMY